MAVAEFELRNEDKTIDDVWRWVGLAIDKPLPSNFKDILEFRIKEVPPYNTLLVKVPRVIEPGFHVAQMGLSARPERPWLVNLLVNDRFVTRQLVNREAPITVNLLVLGEQVWVVPALFATILARLRGSLV